MIDFNTDKKGMAELCGQFMERIVYILEQEKVAVPPREMLAELIMRHAPDWRRILSELQRHIRGGEVSLDVIGGNVTTNIEELFGFLKAKDFKSMRKWVANNMDVESAAIFRGVYDNMTPHMSPNSIPQAVIILADYQYKNAFVADHELNMVACMTELMGTVEFV